MQPDEIFHTCENCSLDRPPVLPTGVLGSFSTRLENCSTGPDQHARNDILAKNRFGS